MPQAWSIRALATGHRASSNVAWCSDARMRPKSSPGFTTLPPEEIPGADLRSLGPRVRTSQGSRDAEAFYKTGASLSYSQMVDSGG